MKKKIEATPIKNPAAKFGILGLSTALGAGYAPIAPGTVGSLLGIPFGLWLLQYPGWMAGIIIGVLCFVTAPIVERACHHWGEMDSGKVVWDEVIGMAIALLGLRGVVRLEKLDVGGFVAPSWESIIVAFIEFRIFDIFKPFPAKTFDQKDSGLGVILDDVVAGLYAALLVWSLVKINWI